MPLFTSVAFETIESRKRRSAIQERLLLLELGAGGVRRIRQDGALAANLDGGWATIAAIAGFRLVISAALDGLGIGFTRDTDVSRFTPASAPRVAHDPVAFSVLRAIADELNCVVDDPAAVTVEDAVIVEGPRSGH